MRATSITILTTALLALSACGSDGAASDLPISAPPTPTTAEPPVSETVVPTDAATSTPEPRHTGGVQSCTGEKVFADPDGDGWGVCNPPATDPPPPSTISREASLAVDDCLKAITADFIGVAQDGDSRTVDIAMAACDEAQSQLKADNYEDSDLSRMIAERLITVAFLGLRIASGESGESEAQKLDDEWVQWYATALELLGDAR